LYNNISIIISVIAILISLAIGAYTLLYAQSNMKNWFLVFIVVVIVFLIGYLLELIAKDTGGAFIAICVLYIGSSFVGPITLFFIADYCEIKLHPIFVKLPLFLISLACMLTLWTTDFHHLMYVSYQINTNFVHTMDFVAGPAYFLFHVYPVAVLLASTGVVIHRIRTWAKLYLRRLLALLGIVLIPFIAEMLYFLINMYGLNTYHIYFTPHALVLVSILLYFTVIRLDFLGISTIANEKAIDYISDSYILLDRDLNYLISNPAAGIMFTGIGRLERGEPIQNMTEWPEVLVDFDKTLESSSIEFEIESTSGSRSTRYFVAEITKIISSLDTRRSAWALLIRDMTPQKLLTMQLEEYAFRDTLTGLNNRRHFMELITPELGRTKRMGTHYHIMMCDLDHFKNVNDKFGHLAGDEVLKNAATAIKSAVRNYDIVARYGGEEFIVFIVDSETENTIKLAERIRNDIGNAVTIYGDNEISITISIGVAKSDPDLSVKEVIELADKALYKAKEVRNKVAYAGELTDE
jgi:diguanylate cyclase (GGDEF)-like protein